MQAVLVGAAGVAAAPALGSGVAQAQKVRGKLLPTDLVFTITSRFRPSAVLSDFLTLDDDFLGEGPAYRRLEAAANIGEALGGREPFTGLWQSSTRQEAPYSSVVVDIASFGENGSGSVVVDIASFGENGSGSVGTGLVRDGLNHVFAWYDGGRNAATLEVTILGKRTVLATSGAEQVGNEKYNTPTKCEPGHTLGQTFNAPKPFTAAGGQFPPTTRPGRV